MFGMGTGGSSPLSSPAKGDYLRMVEDRAEAPKVPPEGGDDSEKGQVNRAISTGLLAPCSAYTSGLSTSWSTRALQGELVLRGASHLDAFSGYPVRPWLPGHAAGATTGTPEGRPSRSSRTKDSSSQLSYAHSR